jgi:MYXO-CTERM domain-containing protein
MCALLLLLAFLPPPAHAHPSYVARNPNGAVFGAALGHNNPGPDPGARNAYGRAFDALHLVYDQVLCAMDADGDGQSNGFELGDECCLWSANPACPSAVLAAADISKPFDAASLSARPPCNCSADAERACACCSMAPCAPGGGSGDDDDDDDDDDDGKLLWVGAGAAALAALGLAAYCMWRRRRKAAAAAAEAEEGLLSRHSDHLLN